MDAESHVLSPMVIVDATEGALGPGPPRTANTKGCKVLFLGDRTTILHGENRQVPGGKQRGCTDRPKATSRPLKGKTGAR